MNEFHVLIVDDSPELIEVVGRRIRRRHKIAGRDWHVVFHEVHTDVISRSDKAHFTDKSLDTLIDACYQQPNVILADYGYSNPEISALPPEEYFKKALSPRDLPQSVLGFLKEKHAADKKRAKQVRLGFIANSCRLYLYTYTGKKFRGVAPTPDGRKTLTQQAFPHSDVILVDISHELYEDDAFSGDDKHFRAYLTAGLLAQIINRELLDFVLTKETDRLRHVRYYRSGVSVFVIVLLGGAIGAVGEWLGARVMALAIGGLGVMALVLALVAGIMFFVLGLGIPVLVEQLIPNLRKKVNRK